MDRKKEAMMKKILIGSVLLAVVVFIVLQVSTAPKIEDTADESENELKDWKVEQSSVNGARLNENKNIYQGDTGEVTTIYVTAFPTEDEDGNVLDLSAFDLQTARNKDYNPVLDANVQFGNAEGRLEDLSNTEVVNASIRVRGNSSRGASFKSYKVKLKDGAELFQNQKTLNLNKHVGDVSKITNKFCMDIMAAIPDMASMRTNFFIVYLRDGSLPKTEQEYKYYGLYTHVEQPNKSYLKVRGLDENGSIYKASNFEFRITDALKNVDDPQYDVAAFEEVLKIREGKDHTKLLQMLNDINDLNQDFEKVFAKYFNEENYLTWMACNVLLGNEDTIAHNFLLYSPQNSTTWYLLPWDYDGTFKFGEYKSSFSVPDSLAGVQRMSGVLLHRRYFKQPGSMEKLTAKIEELMAVSITEEKVNELLDSYKPVLASVLTKYPDIGLAEIPPNEHFPYLDQFYHQIVSNFSRYKESIHYPMPVFVSEPEVRKDGSVYFSWEPSYDYNGGLVKYNIKLAKDAGMNQIIFSKEGIAENEYTYSKKLAPGTYYLQLTITNEAGYTQCSLDYEVGEGNIRGMLFGIRKIVIP